MRTITWGGPRLGAFVKGFFQEIINIKKNTTNMITYLALCRLQLIFIIWPYLVNNHITYLEFIIKVGDLEIGRT